MAGRLRLLHPLGEGGMGTVWAAHHLTLDTDVAVKFIRADRAATDPKSLSRFRREARAAARIKSPHVVEIKDFGTLEDGVPHIVMELLGGCTLADLLRREGPLGLDVAADIVEQVALALEGAHEVGVVHRDVKPQNIFVLGRRGSQRYAIKVLDFGIAKLVDERRCATGDGGTETGVAIGSPAYMSPEQIEGSATVDHRSDLWALGVVAYRLLTGALPFDGPSSMATGAAVLSGRYVPVTVRRSVLPRALDDWMAKALCVHRTGRFSSARESAAAFRVALGESWGGDGAGAKAEPPSSRAALGSSDTVSKTLTARGSIARAGRPPSWALAVFVLGAVAAISFASLDRRTAAAKEGTAWAGGGPQPMATDRSPAPAGAVDAGASAEPYDEARVVPSAGDSSPAPSAAPVSRAVTTPASPGPRAGAAHAAPTASVPAAAVLPAVPPVDETEPTVPWIARQR